MVIQYMNSNKAYFILLGQYLSLVLNLVLSFETKFQKPNLD